MDCSVRVLPIVAGAAVAALGLGILTVVVRGIVGLASDGTAMPEVLVIGALVVTSIVASLWHRSATRSYDAPSKTRGSEPTRHRRGRARQSTITTNKAPVIASQRRYTPPPTSLLALVPRTGVRDRVPCAAAVAHLVEALASFDVAARVLGSHEGPAVRTHDAVLARGTRLGKVFALTDDLSLALGRKVRIAPSGMGQVSFEVARETRAVVGLRELLEDDSVRTVSASLPITFGVGARGVPLVGDLAEMPHLLVAGATGTGKSVGLNVMLTSLLFACSPAALRLVLIDPKQVELAAYEGVPHLHMPIVRDMGLVAKTLASLIAEMDHRYATLAEARCRRLASFNARSAKPLPRVVVVIDELADLLASDRKTIEPLLLRLAQKGRASHIIAATQRPSVDVVSGVLKANVSARVSYRVASAVDSRVVLDATGAEQLTGRGDALVCRRASETAQI
jgi:S-DNA-T family DNA segregation ATPase FtsK/SpoIIIE